MYYTFVSDGQVRSGNAQEEKIRSMAIAWERDVQVWSHDINHDDAIPLFYYDSNGVKHTHNDGDN